MSSKNGGCILYPAITDIKVSNFDQVGAVVINTGAEVIRWEAPFIPAVIEKVYAAQGKFTVNVEARDTLGIWDRLRLEKDFTVSFRPCLPFSLLPTPSVSAQSESYTYYKFLEDSDHTYAINIDPSDNTETSSVVIKLCPEIAAGYWYPTITGATLELAERGGLPLSCKNSELPFIQEGKFYSLTVPVTDLVPKGKLIINGSGYQGLRVQIQTQVPVQTKDLTNTRSQLRAMSRSAPVSVRPADEFAVLGRAALLNWQNKYPDFQIIN